MTDEKKCEPPPKMRLETWMGEFAAAAQKAGWRVEVDLVSADTSATPPATVAALVEALEGLMDVQTFATGWDNGVTDSTGTMNEGDHWHGLAMDRATAALALYRKENGR